MFGPVPKFSFRSCEARSDSHGATQRRSLDLEAKELVSLGSYQLQPQPFDGVRDETSLMQPCGPQSDHHIFLLIKVLSPRRSLCLVFSSFSVLLYFSILYCPPDI